MYQFALIFICDTALRKKYMCGFLQSDLYWALRYYEINHLREAITFWYVMASNQLSVAQSKTLESALLTIWNLLHVILKINEWDHGFKPRSRSTKPYSTRS